MPRNQEELYRKPHCCDSEGCWSCRLLSTTGQIWSANCWHTMNLSLLRLSGAYELDYHDLGPILHCWPNPSTACRPGKLLLNLTLISVQSGFTLVRKEISTKWFNDMKTSTYFLSLRLVHDAKLCCPSRLTLQVDLADTLISNPERSRNTGIWLCWFITNNVVGTVQLPSHLYLISIVPWLFFSMMGH